MQRTFYVCRFYCAVIFVGLFLSACGDSTGQLATSNDEFFREAGDLAPRPTDLYFLVVSSERERDVNVTESVPLKVSLLSKVTGEGVANEAVNFEIVDEAAGNATLSARNSTTNESGEAVVDFRAGVNEATVIVRARHASSNGVEFHVRIHKLGTGGVHFRVVNSAPTIMRLSNIEMRAYRSDMLSCAEFYPLQTQPEALAQTGATEEGQWVTFEDLGAGQPFVFTATARGPEGQLAAGACVDRVFVEADRFVEQEIILQLIPLNPSGIYDVVSYWDFTDVLADAGPAGQAILRVFNVFHNPGRALYDEAINLVTLLVNGFVGGAIDTFLSITGLDQMLEDVINDFVENTDFLRQIRDAGRDLRDVAANLQVHSELVIGKLGTGYEFRGRDNWLGITLYWRWGCESDAPPSCGAIELVPDSNGEFAQLGLLSAEWDGRVVAYNQLQVDQHTVSLRYGRLLRYILNDVILPAITNGNASSLSQAFAYWINCPSIGNYLIPGGQRCVTVFGSDIVCVTSQQITNICDTAVSTIFGFADLLIRNLEFDMGLHLGGDGRLVEMTSNGIVDIIEDGRYEGYVRTGESTAASASFSAEWSAQRRGFTAE